MMAAAAYLCAVCCSSPSPEDLSIVPQPGVISLSGGWFRTDSADFRANPSRGLQADCRKTENHCELFR